MITRRRVYGAGLWLSVTERGEAGAPTIVLVHGFPDTSAVWTPVADLLAERFHVVTYDVRGAGASDTPEHTAAYRLPLLVDDLIAVVDAVSPGRPVHLVGHDWGSVQGWEAVSDGRHDDRFASFTSIAAPPLDHAAQWMRRKLEHREWRALVAQGARSSYVAAFHTPGVAWLAAHSGRLPTRRAWQAALTRREGACVDESWPAETFPSDASHGMKLYIANVRDRMRRPVRHSTPIPVQLVILEDDAYVPPSFLEGLEQWSPTTWRRSIDTGHWAVRTRPHEIASAISEVVDHLSEGGPEPPELRRFRVQGDGSRGATTTAPPAPRGEASNLRARRTRFDLNNTKAVWIPGDPQTSHTINVLHVLLPPGERWFCDVYRDALPLVGDATLREQMRGFIAQEATHAKAHDGGLEYLARDGIDVRAEVAVADRVRVRGRRALRYLPAPALRRVLATELAVIAAVEHFTGVLGEWILDAEPLDTAGADAVMMDLLRWHGAEEVEHRSVAFDAYQELGGGYGRRVVAMAGVFGALTVGWAAITERLMIMDTDRPGHFRIAAFNQAGALGRLPRFRDIAASIPVYLRRDHHPSHVGSTEKALAYLATSPGVTATAKSA